MKPARLDIQPGGEWALPFAKARLRLLRAYAQSTGLEFSMKRWYVTNLTVTVVYNLRGLDHIRIELGGFFCIAEYVTTGFQIAMAMYTKTNFESSRSFKITHPHTVPWLKPDGSQAIVLAGSDGSGNASIQRISGSKQLQGDPVVINTAMTTDPVASRDITQLYHVDPSTSSPDVVIGVYDIPSATRTPKTITLGANFSRHLHGAGDKQYALVMFADTGTGVEVRASKLINDVWTDYTVGTFANSGTDATIQGPIGNTFFQPDGIAFDDSDNIYYVLAVPVNVGDGTYSALTMHLYQNATDVLTLGTLNLWSNTGVAAFAGSPFAIQQYSAKVHGAADGSALLVTSWSAEGVLRSYSDAAVWLVVAGVATLMASTTGGASNTVKPQGLGMTADGSKFCITKGTDALFYEDGALVATVTTTRNLRNDGVQWWYNRTTGAFVYMDHNNNRLYRVNTDGETLIGSFTSPATATIEGTAYTLSEAAARGSVWVASDLV